MKALRMVTVRYLVRASIMAGFSYYISVLVKNRGITYYIAPSMEIYIKLAAVALLVIAAYQAFLAVRSSWGEEKQVAGCECGDDHHHAHSHDHSHSVEHNRPSKPITVKTLVVYCMFVLPLLLGLLLPDAALNSALAAKKGVNLSGATALKKNAPTASASPDEGIKGNSTALSITGTSSTDPKTDQGQTGTAAATGTDNPAQGKQLTDAEIDKMFYVENEYDKPYAQMAKKLYKQPVIQIKEEGFIELTTVIDMFKDSFLGKKIELSGFVYREPDMKSDQFVVARFAVQCCSADGMPFGFVNEYPQAQNYAKDEWIKVSGTIGKTIYNENEIVKINVEKVSKIKAPETPYVYPNYEYLTKAS